MNEQRKPKVSFIIPTLNAAHILHRCLESIRSQNYPQEKVEIVISDGGSEDDTLKIAKKYNAKIIKNREVLHEPGKSLASTVAKGELLFYTDADNILSHKNWIDLMLKPYNEVKGVKGLLPQTEPPPDSSSLNRYLSYLFTDPFTWFVYQNSANPKDYDKVFKPTERTPDYNVYKFTSENLPLFGLSQGVGTTNDFQRTGIGKNDDLLAGIKLINEGGLVAHVPKAGVYHYHVQIF
jgi:glycosyltransferase involved in cell wall biosynthesis